MEVLRTDRLSLRWFNDDDAPRVLELLNEPAWIANVSDPGVRDVAAAREWMQSRLVAPYWTHGHGFWAVERRADGEFLGLCGVFKRAALPHADLGYGLLARHHGHGYAREAAAACLRYAHEVLGLDTVLAITAPHNAASARLLAAIAMTDRGLHPVDGYAHDERLFESHHSGSETDAAQIDALAARFLGAFDNRGDALPKLAALPCWLLPDAQIRRRDAHAGIDTMDVRGFVLPRAELLFGGRLREFSEAELTHETRIHGAIAQRWLRYRKAGVLDGAPWGGTGSKSLQLVKCDGRWRIAAVMWEDDEV